MNDQGINKKKSRIPEFSSYEEEANFWDTHSTTDFEDEFKPIRVRFAKDLSKGPVINNGYLNKSSKSCAQDGRRE